MRNKERALETIEKRKALRERLGNMWNDDIRAICGYLYKDAMIEMIMKCDPSEIEHAIKHIQP